MLTKSKLLMITAATFITGSAVFAQTEAPVEDTPVDIIAALTEFFATPQDDAAIAAKLGELGLRNISLRSEDDGEVRISALNANGERVRVRLDDDGELRIRIGDDNPGSSSDANGDDSSDTSDSNGDDSGSSSDSNGGDSGGSSGNSSDD